MVTPAGTLAQQRSHLMQPPPQLMGLLGADGALVGPEGGGGRGSFTIHGGRKGGAKVARPSARFAGPCPRRGYRFEVSRPFCHGAPHPVIHAALSHVAYSAYMLNQAQIAAMIRSRPESCWLVCNAGCRHSRPGRVGSDWLAQWRARWAERQTSWKSFPHGKLKAGTIIHGKAREVDGPIEITGGWRALH